MPYTKAKRHRLSKSKFLSEESFYRDFETRKLKRERREKEQYNAKDNESK